MKITELKCSACDGTLKIDENNPGYAECEYCHTRYMIEWESPEGGSGGEGNAYIRPLTAQTPAGMPEIEYQPLPVKKEQPKRTGWEYDGWKRLTLCAVCLVVIIAIWRGPAIYQRYKQDHPNSSEALSGTAQELKESQSGGLVSDGSDAPGAAGSLSGILADFAEIVFEKPAETVTDKELSKIAWIEFKSAIETYDIGYSFDNPLEQPDAELTWVSFPRDAYGALSVSGLNAFSGLKVLAASGITIQAKDLEGLSLEGLTGYYSSLEEVAGAVDRPELLKSVKMIGSPSSLKGIDQLPNLERLAIQADTIEEEKAFAGAASLKEVALDMYDGTMDFSVFGVMPGLESLTIESKNLRDISFVSKMSGLKSLNLKYGEFLSVEPLSGMAGLTKLSIENCDEIASLEAVESLTGLKELALDLPYGCPEPDLGGLSELEVLYLNGFDGTGFLKGMTQLRRLTLDGCPVDTPSDFAGLTKLETLVCTAFGYTQQDYSFIMELPAVEHVYLSGTITYGDISGIFNLPTLKTLDISNMECAIDFSNIAENTTLEELSMDHMKLYTNVNVANDGVVSYVDWDDVELTDHLDFLGKLTGLKNLSIRENELTDLNFVSSVPGLVKIDFSDNYVTDLSPLSGLKGLRQVNCADNPISNYEVLGDSVIIMK